MKITNVAVNVRYAQEIEGAWKTVEVGAEATVAEGEQWTLCQQGLFAQLSTQLREVWAMGKNGHEKPVEEASWEEIKAMPSPREHYCPVHKTEFRRFEKD